MDFRLGGPLSKDEEERRRAEMKVAGKIFFAETKETPWHEMDKEQKEGVLQKIENALAPMQGRDTAKVRAYPENITEFKEGRDELAVEGWYSHSPPTISINEQKVMPFGEAADKGLAKLFELQHGALQTSEITRVAIEKETKEKGGIVNWKERSVVDDKRRKAWDNSIKESQKEPFERDERDSEEHPLRAEQKLEGKERLSLCKSGIQEARENEFSTAKDNRIKDLQKEVHEQQERERAKQEQEQERQRERGR